MEFEILNDELTYYYRRLHSSTLSVTAGYCNFQSCNLMQVKGFTGVTTLYGSGMMMNMEGSLDKYIVNHH